MIFSDVEMEDFTNPGNRVRAQPGDYVLVKVSCPLVFGLSLGLDTGLGNLGK